MHGRSDKSFWWEAASDRALATDEVQGAAPVGRCGPQASGTSQIVVPTARISRYPLSTVCKRVGCSDSLQAPVQEVPPRDGRVST